MCYWQRTSTGIWFCDQFYRVIRILGIKKVMQVLNPKLNLFITDITLNRFHEFYALYYVEDVNLILRMQYILLDDIHYRLLLDVIVVEDATISVAEVVSWL